MRNELGATLPPTTYLEPLLDEAADLLETLRADLQFAIEGLERFRKHAKEDQAEIETLRAQVTRWRDEFMKMVEIRDAKLTEIETLRARIQKGNEWMTENEAEHRAEIETLRARVQMFETKYGAIHD